MAADEDVILTELNEVQGNLVDIGGYYYPDREKTTAVMRPSPKRSTPLAGGRRRVTRSVKRRLRVANDGRGHPTATR